MRYLLAAMAIAAAPASADDLATRFATRPAAIQVALSPGGDRIVTVGAYKTGGRAVTVSDLTTGETRAVIAGAEIGLRPDRCGFKTETRIICTIYGVVDHGNSYTRILAVDTDGSHRKLLSDLVHPQDHDGGDIIDWLPDDPHHVMIAERGAERIDVDTGHAVTVDGATHSSAVLGTDGTGEVRFRGLVDGGATGYVNDAISYSVRPKGRRDWVRLGRAALSDERAVTYLGFDAGGDHLYALAPRDGRQALFTVATDGSNAQSLVFAHPTVDVDGVLRIGKYRRPVAATFTLDRPDYHFFDPPLARLATSLRKALPGQPDVAIVDESWDGRMKLVYADGAGRPGRYYRYDATRAKLGELLPVYPALDGVALGAVTAIGYGARDGTTIPGFLTLPPGKADARGLPGIVLPHGGPSARDAAGFDWLAQFLAAEGFAVLQPNFRGSAGYGAAFAAKNGFQSWALAIGDIDDGARWLVGQGVPAARLAIVGWSYGGYAALQASVVEPGLYRAVVAIAPVTDLDLLRQRAEHYTNFKMVAAMIGTGDVIRAGSPARNAAKITAPVLLFHGDRDLNVDIEQSRTMATALRRAGKRVELVEYTALDHQLDDSVARADLLTRAAAFLKAAIE